MCGRFSLTTPVEAMSRLFGFTGAPNLASRFNIAPTTNIAVIASRGGDGGEADRSVGMMRWGLVPSWAKAVDGSQPLINARAETIADKPSFRQAFLKRRCLVPADSFFEWKLSSGGARQAYRLHDSAGFPFVMAAVWERWLPPHGQAPLLSVAIITKPASSALSVIHHRMPVILKPEQLSSWLSKHTESTVVQSMLYTAENETIIAYPVDNRVGQVSNDDEDLWRQVDVAATPRQGVLFN